MSLRDEYATDKQAEVAGRWFDLRGGARMLLARAGGANKNFTKVYEAVFRPHRRRMDAKAMPPDETNELLMQVYAKSVVLDWQGVTDRDLHEDGEGDGKPVPYSPKACLQLFKALPDLFYQPDSDLPLGVFQLASNAGIFRVANREEDAKNS